MNLMTEISEEEISKVSKADFVPWNELSGKTILVTGATGLIGYTTILGLLYANDERNLNISIVALVRNIERAEQRFGKWSSKIKFALGTVEELPFFEENIDYIIHGASQTASKGFVETPVETIKTSVLGTLNLLELAKEKNVAGFIYLSSMEMYGYPAKGHKVTEDEAGALSPLNVRNSYPIAKQECESLCCAYAKEYSVPTKIIRLTQTFGPGVNYNDNRIFAYFGRCAVEKQNIVLKTKGETERCYLYSIDAVTAILTILLKGKNGKVYNAADEDTYCSIAEMAEKVAAENGVNVEYQIQDLATLGYPDTLYMDLDTSMLKNLGWKPIWGGIGKMYKQMIEAMEILKKTS